MNDIKRKALLFASNVHKGEVRKGGLPYILHPVSVGMILLENGASNEVVAAGFLHDTVEDAHVSPDVIKKEFGEKVYNIVMFDTEDKSKTWEERKTTTLKALESCDDDCAMLILADKLSNILDINYALQKDGDSVWSLFKRGKEKQEWLYLEYLQVFKRFNHLKMYQELKQQFDEVFGKKEIYKKENNNQMNIAYDNNITLITLVGNVDATNADEFEKVITEANILDSVIINAKDLRYISSAGLRVILKLKKKCVNKTLEIINANENIIDILNLTGFSNIISIK